MSKKLSILICSLASREDKLKRLLAVLQPQLTDDVEMVIKTDNGEMLIGAKRNVLVNESTGDYICFIDDDDLISSDYVSKILLAIESKPDCCGMQGVITFKGQGPRMFIHSMKYKEWFEQNNVYYRCPNHLNPVKRELAVQVKFLEQNFGEDKDYSTRLFPLLKNEVFIPGVIYHYLYEKEGPPITNKTIRRENSKNPGIQRIRGW